MEEFFKVIQDFLDSRKIETKTEEPTEVNPEPETSIPVTENSNNVVVTPEQQDLITNKLKTLEDENKALKSQIEALEKSLNTGSPQKQVQNTFTSLLDS